MILNGRNLSRFTEQTIQNVYRASRQMGYVSKKNQRHKNPKQTILIVCPSLMNPYYATLIQSMEQEARLREVIAAHKGQPGATMPVLQAAQEIFGYLPEEVQIMIAEGLDIPLSEVYGVVSFYAQFALNPKGTYQISVCLGTACYVKGSDKLLDRITQKLGIQPEECTEDGLFSLTACRCIGACGLAPVGTVNDQVHSKMSPELAIALLESLRKEDAANA